MLDDLVGQIMHVDDGLADAGLGELVEHMIEQRLAGHAHQRFRHLSVSGRMRTPRPAASTMALVGLTDIVRNFSKQLHGIRSRAESYSR